HWAKDYIGTLAGMNILNGIGDNMFNPEGSLTRAQFIAMLAKMTSGVDVTLSESAGFTDVPDYEWYYGYVNWGYENGIVNGMGDGTFAPNDSITREQMAVMLCNYSRSIGFMLPQIKEGVTFTDYNMISPWALDYVLTSAGAGIINGFDTGDFQPQGVATRAQAASVIYKMCEIKGML
ncbi:MAG: S-layer homology domain-containing protein, partial [Firmicutes bacterium]|nr:S-layer homology domain-containing protein [Bacillota bacterium]